MDTREMADVRGPVPTWPTSVAESQAVAVASNTIATLAIVIRGALIRLQALGTVTVPDLPSRSTLRRRPGAVNNRLVPKRRQRLVHERWELRARVGPVR